MRSGWDLSINQDTVQTNGKDHGNCGGTKANIQSNEEWHIVFYWYCNNPVHYWVVLTHFYGYANFGGIRNRVKYGSFYDKKNLKNQ